MRNRILAAALLALAASQAGCQKRVAPELSPDAAPVATVSPSVQDAGVPASLQAPDAGVPGTNASTGEPGALSEALAQFFVTSSPKLSGSAVEQRSSGPWQLRVAGGSGDGFGAVVGGSRGLARSAAPGAPMAAPAAAEYESKAMAADSFEGAVASPRGGGGAPMRAGSTDDNAGFDAYLDFLKGWTTRDAVAQAHDPIDVRGRRFLKVVDGKGRPQPAARVKVVDLERDALLWAGTTYGDGRLPYYPAVASTRLKGAAASKRLLVEAALGPAHQKVSWDGASDLVIELRDAPAAGAVQLDVVFAIDTTGSMGDEIDRIKATLAKVTEKLRGLDQEFDLRYGAVLYRDLGDDYVTSTHPFTGDLKAFGEALQQVGAGGGGDGPESVNQAIAELTRLDWREGAAKVAFLVGDAPPHMDYPGDVRYGQSSLAALARGIRIHAVAASGLDELGTLVFRQVAQFTRGKFVFIEYGSTAASAAAHGVTGEVKSNNLDDILFEQLRDEVANWGREPAPTVAGGK